MCLRLRAWHTSSGVGWFSLLFGVLGWESIFSQKFLDTPSPPSRRLFKLIWTSISSCWSDVVFLEVSLVVFSFAVAVDYSGSVSGELSLEEISRLFFVYFLVFIGDGRGELFAALSKFSIFFCFIPFSLCLSGLELELSRGASLTGDASVYLVFIFKDSWLSGILVTADLVSDDLTSVSLETGVLEGHVLDTWMIFVDDPFPRHTTFIHSTSTSGFGFFSVAAVDAAAVTNMIFGGLGGFSLAFEGKFSARCPCCLHDQQWDRFPSTVTLIYQSFDVITSGIEALPRQTDEEGVIHNHGTYCTSNWIIVLNSTKLLRKEARIWFGRATEIFLKVTFIHQVSIYSGNNF